MSENELLVRSIDNGDRAALSRLYSMLHSKLTAILTHRGLDPCEADERATDALSKFVLRAHRFDRTKQIMPYLLATTRNDGKDKGRKRKRKPALSTTGLADGRHSGERIELDLLDPRAIKPDGRATLRELRQAARSEIKKMEPKYADPLHAFLFLGLTNEEGAAELGIPITTYKGRLRKAKAKLQFALKNHQ